MIGHASRPTGFTLVELLVALTVLLVGLLGLAATASLVASNLRIARLETQARVLAQAELEKVLAGGSAGVAIGGQAGELQVSVEINGVYPRLVSLVVAGSAGSDSVSDTLMTLLR